MTEPKVTKRTEQKAATRRLLLRVAQAAFAKQPYEEVTMRGIAKAAGTSTGALFSSWEGKEALYRESTGREPPHAAVTHLPAVESFLAEVMVETAGTDFHSLSERAGELRKKLVGSAG